MAIDHRILQQIGVKNNAPVLDIFNSIIQDQRDAPLREQKIQQERIKTDLLRANLGERDLDLQSKTGDFSSQQGRLQQDVLFQLPQSKGGGGGGNRTFDPKEILFRQQEQDMKLAESYARSLQPVLDNPVALIAKLNENKERINKINETLQPDRQIDTTGIDDDIAQAQTPEGLALLAQEVNDTLMPQTQQQRVTASKILEDGTTIQSLSTGGTNVVSPQGEVLTGETRKKALDAALKSKVTQKGDIAQTISDVKVDEAIRLEQETETGRQKVVKGRINIDETKIRNAEQKKQAIDAKNSRRAEADNASLVISDLLGSDSFSSAFGRFNNAPPEGFRTQANIDARAKVDQVVGLLSLESRQKLKGQGTITDSEAKTLERSATTLTNPLISDSVARKELRRVKRIFEDASDRNQLKQETLQQAPPQNTMAGFKILSIK